MTESYSPPAIIKKYYQSDDKTKDGAHLPFNFQMIREINKSSKANDFVTMITDWFAVVPERKVTNWVVSR
jgi:alpha-glucosidase